MRVLVDVDGVVCDLHTTWLARYNADYHDTLTLQAFDAWDAWHKVVKPECGNRIYDYLNENLYSLETPEIAGAREGLERLRRAGDTITFVTSCVSPGMFDPKVEWLRMTGIMYAPDGLIAVLGNTSKLLVVGDVLIDDRAETVQEFAYNGRAAILFSQPWNRGVEHSLRMERWDEVGHGGIGGWMRQTLQERAA